MSWANLLHENDKFSCDSELFSWQVAMVGVGEIGESMECKKCANRDPYSASMLSPFYTHTRTQHLVSVAGLGLLPLVP